MLFDLIRGHMSLAKPATSPTPPSIGYEITESECMALLVKVFRLDKVHHWANGSYGSVFSVTLPSLMSSCEPTRLAWKAYLFGGDRWKTDFENRWESFSREVSAYKSLAQHPNIVTYYTCFQVYHNATTNAYIRVNTEAKLPPPTDESRLQLACVVMEALECSLAEWMARHDLQTLSEAQLKKVFVQIGLALCHIHQEKLLCHMDLKPENIGLVKDCADPHLKLLDFGQSQPQPKEAYLKAMQLSSNVNLEDSLLDGDTALLASHSISGRNMFLLEGYCFGNMLNRLATSGVSERRRARVNDARKLFADNRDHFTDHRFKQILLRLSLEQVTVEWAMKQFLLDFSINLV